MQHLFYGRGNKLVALAVNKYGLENFAFIILATFSNTNAETIILLEQFHIDTIKPEYNIAPLAGTTIGYIHSENTKQVMKDAHKNNPARAERIGALRRGIKMTDDERERIRQ